MKSDYPKTTKETFKNIPYSDPFLKSFREDYEPYYSFWYMAKGEDDVYVARNDNGEIVGLLKLKEEDIFEDYSDISPEMPMAKRLKICSLKAEYPGLGEEFLNRAFREAQVLGVDEIYITIKVNNEAKNRLVNLLHSFGFRYHGEKRGGDRVYRRPLLK